jgi:hypothetical protein
MQFIGAFQEHLRFFGAIGAKPPERAARTAPVLRAEHQVRTVGRPHRPLIAEGVEGHAGWPPAFHVEHPNILSGYKREPPSIR